MTYQDQLASSARRARADHYLHGGPRRRSGRARGQSSCQCHERGLPAEVLDAARFATKREAEHVAHQHGGFARRIREVK
jgi:hypothetical protein